MDARVFPDCEPESEPARILLHPNPHPRKISRVRVHGIFVLLISDKRVLASSIAILLLFWLVSKRETERDRERQRETDGESQS